MAFDCEFTRTWCEFTGIAESHILKVGDYINCLCWGPGGNIYCGGEAGQVSKLADINYT